MKRIHHWRSWRAATVSTLRVFKQPLLKGKLYITQLHISFQLHKLHIRFFSFWKQFFLRISACPLCKKRIIMRNSGPLYLTYQDVITNDVASSSYDTSNIGQRSNSMASNPNQIDGPPNACQQSKSTVVMAETVNETCRQASRSRRNIYDRNVVLSREPNLSQNSISDQQGRQSKRQKNHWRDTMSSN